MCVDIGTGVTLSGKGIHRGFTKRGVHRGFTKRGVHRGGGFTKRGVHMNPVNPPGYGPVDTECLSRSCV